METLTPRGEINLNDQELTELGEVYAAAFAGPPWFEVSKCASTDSEVRCEGGLSVQAIGETCLRCSQTLTEEAYGLETWKPWFTERLDYPAARLYREWNDDGRLLVGGLFFELKPVEIADKKYPDVPSMRDWLGRLPDRPLVWLDEIFANRELRASGNLWNFGPLVRQVLNESQWSQLAFRTINEGLIAATRRDFGDQAKIYARKYEVPDRRDFAIISKPQPRPVHSILGSAELGENWPTGWTRLDSGSGI